MKKIKHPIKILPLTDEELREVQITVTSKILRLNSDIQAGKISNKSECVQELETLCSVAEKCAHHSLDS